MSGLGVSPVASQLSISRQTVKPPQKKRGGDPTKPKQLCKNVRTKWRAPRNHRSSKVRVAQGLQWSASCVAIAMRLRHICGQTKPQARKPQLRRAPARRRRQGRTRRRSWPAKSGASRSRPCSRYPDQAGCLLKVGAGSVRSALRQKPCGPSSPPKHPSWLTGRQWG